MTPLTLGCCGFSSSLEQFSGISHIFLLKSNPVWLNYSSWRRSAFARHLRRDFCATFVSTVFLCHRRIDVSPRAFKKHSQLFEAMKSSEDDAYKVTEHSAVWSMLEAHEWPSQRPLELHFVKSLWFSLKRGSKCLRSAKAKHGIMTLLYTAPTWLECGHKPDWD